MLICEVSGWRSPLVLCIQLSQTDGQPCSMLVAPAVGMRAGRMVPAFLLGTVGTVLGSWLAVVMLSAPLVSTLGADGLKVAAALCAKNIGGGLNFVAVAAALGTSPLAFTAALTVDNVMALIYFPLVASLGRGQSDPGGSGASEREQADEDAAEPGSTSAEEAAGGSCVATEAVSRQSAALAAGLTATALSRVIAARLAAGFELPIATLLTVAAATLAPRILGPLAPSATELGTTCLYLFFATAGWTGGAIRGSAMLRGGPVLLAFLSVLYAVHLAVVLGLGTLARRVFAASPRVQQCVRLPQLLVASNANIGGPATASALATGNGWPSLVAPSLLVGNLGCERFAISKRRLQSRTPPLRLALCLCGSNCAQARPSLRMWCADAIATPLAVILHEGFKAHSRAALLLLSN